MLNCFIKTSHFRSFFFDEKQNGLSHRKNKKTAKLKTTIAMLAVILNNLYANIHFPNKIQH